MSHAGVNIRRATEADLPVVRALLAAYVEWLDLDLSFQDFDREYRDLPGDYGPPRGTLLVACGGNPLGLPGGLLPLIAAGDTLLAMIALRPLDESVCEMKRLFVQPSARGLGLGRALIARLLSDARDMGYREMRLDTLPVMRDAQSLYEAFGFRDITPYYDSPIPGTRFMGMALRRSDDRVR